MVVEQVVCGVNYLGGGGGLLTDGQVGSGFITPARAYVNGGTGGVRLGFPHAGFGGGGFGSGAAGGGGGGGYSGGGSAWFTGAENAVGGGGGSFNIGTAQTNIAGTNSGNGIVTISYLNPTTIAQTAGLASGTSFPVGTTTNTFVATDAFGNTATCSIDVTVNDTENPVVTCTEFTKTFSGCPDSIGPNTPSGSWSAIGADGKISTAIGGSYISILDLSNCVTDNCTDLADLEWGLFASYEENRIAGVSVDIINEIMVRDASGNISPDHIISRGTIQYDGPPPVITCPANVTIECGGDTSPANTGRATYTSSCGSSSLTFADASTPGCGNTETIARTWTATDNRGQSSRCVQIITVVDTTPPSIACPADVQLYTDAQCYADTTPGNTGTATGTDNCSGGVTITFSDVVSADDPCIGSEIIKRTWTATDDCGNSSSCVQTIKVSDNRPPTIVCPANVQLFTDENCYADTTPGNTGTATGTDNCSGVTIAFKDVDIDELCIGGKVIYRKWTATDDCGNASECFQVIYVRDIIPPTIACPEKAIELLGCNPPRPTMDDAVNATRSADNCSVASVVAYPGPVTGNCYKSQTFNVVVTDDCGNNANCDVTYTWFEDFKPPVIDCHEDRIIDLGCNPSEKDFPTGQSLIDNGYVTAWDECSASPPVITLDRSELINNGCKSFLKYYYKAIDDCGNETQLEDMCAVTYKWSVDDIRDCETNYARYKEGTTNFGDDPELNNGGFGWTNHLAVPGVYTMELYSEGVIGDVGEAIVTYTGETVTVDYRIYEGYNMSEANVYLGFNKYPKDEGGDYSVDLDDFNYPIGALDNVYTYTVGPIAVKNAQDGIYVIARGVVCREKCRCSSSKDDGGSYLLGPSNDTLDYNEQFSLSSNTVERNANFTMYPVPFEDEVFVEYSFDYQTDVTIEVYDLKGALLKRVENNNYTASSQTKTKLDLRAFSDQMFFVKLTTDKGVGVKKIISN